MKRQSGFTLIEMVAVIIILAILAAVAFPRFTNLTAKARLSALHGLVGGLRSAVVLAKSTWLTEDSGILDTIEMNGVYVSVVTGGPTSTVAERAIWGTPTSGILGIGRTLDSFDGFSSALDPVSGMMFWPEGATAPLYCAAYYLSGTVTLAPSAIGISATSACF
ncbi:MAG: prepilin-type N-terminal cleavage/methylation domain-containing protein [Sulfuricellaceae bacterium]